MSPRLPGVRRWQNGLRTGECGAEKARISATVPWCSGLAYVPVKDEIAGSNPVGTARLNSDCDAARHRCSDHRGGLMDKSRWIAVVLLALASMATATLSTPFVGPAPASAACTSSTGPGIPPPATVPTGVNTYHSSWYGQSGYMTLCPGDTSLATV